MATATITFSATVEADGETKTVASSGTINARSVHTGKQTIGNSYETLAIAAPQGCIVIIKNTGTVDVSVRMQLQQYTTSQYAFLNCVAGGIVVVPRHYLTDITGTLPASLITGLSARTDSGTADIEYCIII